MEEATARLKEAEGFDERRWRCKEGASKMEDRGTIELEVRKSEEKGRGEIPVG